MVANLDTIVARFVPTGTNRECAWLHSAVCQRRPPRSRCAASSSATARSRPSAGLDLTVPVGICFGLLGPNGAGKSTTMRMLTAQAIADDGTIDVLGHRLPEGSKQARMAMGVVPQLDNLDVELTCRQILSVFARLYRVPGSERARGRRPGAHDREPREPGRYGRP